MIRELIDKINRKCPSGQGIFFQPTGISTDIKELVIYSRYESEWRGGSCWDDENTVNDIHYNDAPEDHFKVLDIVLEEIAPNLTQDQYQDVRYLIREDQETDSGYYGDYTTYTCQYIVLSQLEEYLVVEIRDKKINDIFER